MRKTTGILRLKHEVGLTHRQIARSCGLSHPTVSKYLERAQQAGLGWPLPENVDEEHLQALLFPAAEDGSRPSRPLPDMEYIHKELRRAHVTRHLLWEEYRADHADGYSYTQFCEHYRRWKAPLEVTLRQRHIAGEKTFLDWAGKTLSWTDKATGEIHPAYLFVAVLGASNYTFAETFADQQLPAWLDAHIHAVEFFGGVTKLWIPDNAKTGVHKPCYYEPQINDSYQDLADHYGTAILPTRMASAHRSHFILDLVSDVEDPLGLAVDYVGDVLNASDGIYWTERESNKIHRRDGTQERSVVPLGIDGPEGIAIDVAGERCTGRTSGRMLFAGLTWTAKISKTSSPE